MSEEIIRVPLPQISESGGDVIAAFNSALLAMDDYRQTLAEAGDWESLAHGLANLLDFRANVNAVLQSIERDIYQLMPDKKQIIEGVGILEKRRANSKKWESERLLRDIVRAKLETETGEISPSDVFSLISTLEKVLPLTGSLGWRVNALKEENIDIDDYCDVTWGRPTISFTK